MVCKSSGKQEQEQWSGWREARGCVETGCVERVNTWRREDAYVPRRMERDFIGWNVARPLPYTIGFPSGTFMNPLDTVTPYPCSKCMQVGSFISGLPMPYCCSPWLASSLRVMSPLLPLMWLRRASMVAGADAAVSRSD